MASGPLKFTIPVDLAALGKTKEAIKALSADAKAAQKEMETLARKGKQIPEDLKQRAIQAEKQLGQYKQLSVQQGTRYRQAAAADARMTQNIANLPGGAFGQQFATGAFGRAGAARLGGMIGNVGGALGAVSAFVGPALAAVAAYKSFDEALNNRSPDYARAKTSSAMDRITAGSMMDFRRNDLERERLREQAGINELLNDRGGDRFGLGLARANNAIGTVLRQIPLVGDFIANNNIISSISTRVNAGRERRLGSMENQMEQSSLGLSTGQINEKRAAALARSDSASTFGFFNDLKRGVLGNTTEDEAAATKELSAADKAQSEAMNKIMQAISTRDTETAMRLMKKYNPNADAFHQVWADPAALWTSMEGSRIAGRRWAASNTQRAGPRTGD